MVSDRSGIGNMKTWSLEFICAGPTDWLKVPVQHSWLVRGDFIATLSATRPAKTSLLNLSFLLRSNRILTVYGLILFVLLLTAAHCAGYRVWSQDTQDQTLCLPVSLIETNKQSMIQADECSVFVFVTLLSCRAQRICESCHSGWHMKAENHANKIL